MALEIHHGERILNHSDWLPLWLVIRYPAAVNIRMLRDYLHKSMRVYDGIYECIRATRVASLGESFRPSGGRYANLRMRWVLQRITWRISADVIR